MYPNLQAEQARLNLNNTDIATKLSLSRQAYERKKTTGKFYPDECKALCEVFNTPFEYLFSTNPKKLI